MSAEEIEEVKTLSRHLLSSIVWPVRVPKDQASYIMEFTNHIKVKFNEPAPNKYSRELNEFTNLRNIAMSTLTENSFRDNNSLKVLKKYYCQLASMLARFKDSAAEFSWKDSFGRGVHDGNLEFELNNIMYNIAAIHNELASKIPRTNEIATREACSQFSHALWWVTELRDNKGGLKPKEMGHDLLTFYHHVLKGQAQECIFIHSIRTGMKPGSVAKICAQIASDYDVASKLAQTPLYTNDPLKEIMGGASTFNTWRATVDFKQKYYSAITQLLLGLVNGDSSAKEISIRIARLRFASLLIEPAKKLAGDTLDSQASKSAFDILHDLITRKLDKAIRYNDNVYHSTIPGRETLPSPECKLLISPTEFSVTSMPDFKDLFSNLVTIESVVESSLYTQMKDDLSRETKTKVQKQDEELAHMMSTLNFDKKTLRFQPFEAPDELMEICAELSMNPNVVDDVLTKLENLDDQSEEIQNILIKVQEMIARRPNNEYENELKKFKSTHEDALRTTQTLHKQLHPELKHKIQLLATTSDPQELLPKTVSTSSEDEDVIKKLDRLLDKIDMMKSERAQLLSQLVGSLKQDDDVIKHVVTAMSSAELKKVFDKEIQKHNKYIEPLMKNLDAQNELLDSLEKVTAQYGQVKLNHRSQKAACMERVDAFKKFYAQFKATSEGIDQGLEYHKKMLELVRKFYAKVQASNDLNDLLN